MMLKIHFLPFIVFFLSVNCFAQTPPENDTIPKLVVGLCEQPPFAMKTEEKLWDGISIDLWRQLADELDLVYEFREVPDDSLLSLVQKGELDVALGITARREAEAETDLSPVYFISSMGVAGTSSQSLTSIAKGIFTMQFLRIAIWISSLLLIVGVLIWFIERRKNKEHFGGDRSFWSGIGSGFWWAGVTMTTIGYGDKAPITFLGRALALLWMLIAMAITASLTAAIVSAIGFDQAENINSIEDLRGKKLGVVAGSPTAQFLRNEKISFETFPSVVEGLQALEEDKIKIFADDAARLRYTLNRNSDFESTVEVVQLNQQYHVFAWQEDWSLQDQLKLKMFDIISDPFFANLLNRYAPK